MNPIYQILQHIGPNSAHDVPFQIQQMMYHFQLWIRTAQTEFVNVLFQTVDITYWNNMYLSDIALCHTFQTIIWNLKGKKCIEFLMAIQSYHKGSTNWSSNSNIKGTRLETIFNQRNLLAFNILLLPHFI